MTEIKKIKSKVQLILNDDSGGSWNKNHDSDYYAKINLAKLELLEEDIPSLLSTIESQKEEKAQLEESIRYLISTTDNEMEDVAYHKVLELMYPLVNRQGEDSQNSQIESLKAITELAVKENDELKGDIQRIFERSEKAFADQPDNYALSIALTMIRKWTHERLNGLSER